MYMAARLRAGVPHDTGEMQNSIHQNKNTVSIMMGQRDWFNYFHWINQTPGMNEFYISRGKTYDQVVHTGTPRFYSKSLLMTRNQFREASIEQVRKTLRAEF